MPVAGPVSRAICQENLEPVRLFRPALIPMMNVRRKMLLLVALPGPVMVLVHVLCGQRGRFVRVHTVRVPGLSASHPVMVLVIVYHRDS